MWYGSYSADYNDYLADNYEDYREFLDSLDDEDWGCIENDN